MQLQAERDQRIKIWLKELESCIFEKLSDLSFEGFTTMERMTYEEAMSRKFHPMPKGTGWGGKWEYGWFRTELILPPGAGGRRIFLHPEVGGEMLLWINGRIAGSRDLQHTGITLTSCAKGGERYLIAAESYAGHGPRLEKGGPCPEGRIAVPEPSDCQVEVGDCNFGIWNEDAYQLLMDAYTLNQLLKGLDPKTLRAMKVREGLFQFTKIADFELEPEKRDETFREARRVLAPLLSCVNGSTAPVFSIFGQSHLDLAWKWPWEETRRKCARTISSQIALSDEYGEYKFLLCEPPIMENLKENYPELYSRLRKKVEEGTFIPEGGMYVESDTNLVSGESLIRQCLYGRKWFKEEFQIESKMVWLPDCFGFNGQLPQIMKGCGFQYFATQKLARALKGCDVFPYNTFWWEGIDGTRILTNFHRENNAKIEPLDMIKRWNDERVQQENIDTFLYPFGYGDGGGGATREMAEIARRLKDLEGAPRTRMEGPVEFFDRLMDTGHVKEVYKGELYLPWHRGTYTSQARMKKENRRTEGALREAEMWSGIAAYLSCGENRQKELESLWKTLLFNQFHDIIPGTSITRVYEEALEDLRKVKEGAGELCAKACQRLGGQSGEGITVFNSLSWEREEIAELPLSIGESLYQNNRKLVTQKEEHKILALIKVPSCGYTTITNRKIDGGQEVPERAGLCSVSSTERGFVLENQLVRVLVDPLGRVCEYVDKESGAQFVDKICNDLRMYKDVNIDYDAWEMSSFYEELPVDLDTRARVVIDSQGPLEAAVLVERSLNKSPMVQRIVLRANKRRLDFETRIDWKETHKLLKAAFTVNVQSEAAHEEIQFGYVKRPTHKNRRYDADRYEVCHHRYTALSEPGRTAAVLNDSKYGISTNGNSMELTLLKAPVWPDMYADQGIQEFTYSFYGCQRDFENSGVIREGMELNNRLKVCKEGGGEQSWFYLSAPDVILETVKMAEDQRADLVLRLYEAAGRHSACTMSAAVPFDMAFETTMEEVVKEQKPLLVKGKEGRKEIFLEFAPFEIKTIRLLQGQGISCRKNCNQEE